MQGYVPPQPGNKIKVTQVLSRKQWAPPSQPQGKLGKAVSLGFIPGAASPGLANPAARREQLYSGQSPRKRKHTVMNADKGYRTTTAEGTRGLEDRRDTPKHVRARLLKLRNVSPTRSATSTNEFVALPQTSRPGPPQIEFYTVTGAVDRRGGSNTKPGQGIPLSSCEPPPCLIRGMERPFQDVDKDTKFINLRFEWPAYASTKGKKWIFDSTQTNGRPIAQATINELGTAACTIVLSEYERIKPLHNEIWSFHKKLRIMASDGAVAIPKENVRVMGLWQAPAGHPCAGDFIVMVDYKPPVLAGR